MLHLEFAISPNQIRNMTDLNLLEARLGFDKGAVLSRFPENWLKEVSDHLATALNAQQIDKATEKLRRIKESRLVSFNREYAGTPWREAAVDSHQAQPFHRVVDGTTDNRPHYIANWQDLDDDDFDFNTQFNRDATSLAGAAKALLLNAEKVTIYDNYICPTRPGDLSTLREIMTVCGKAEVELHVYSKDYGKPPRQERARLLNQFCQGLPQTIRLFWYWIDDRGSGLLHQRGLFTAKGGLIYDRGFEEPLGRRKRLTPTTIIPMPRALLEDRARLFNPAQLGGGLSLVGTVWQSHP
ncbi:hypothetical protein NRL09_19520 [Aeromonas caviae]|uniref:hypothetical protein n=1 Tax=Aeromonas caviae TaxID=648 RepID=UPI0024C91726|nr:hypothetical protein NRL03_19580 [Aeromonas caviae]WAF63940.1 hypothetical protein NRL19_19620 [Aeromonas caviae]WAF80772.1 hypothetical protein NRL09_19520 [Aeromonas caviae]